MNKTKTFTHNKSKYKYIFCDIAGLIEFFKLDLRIIPNFESIIKAHRPNDIDFKYTKIINEDIQVYLYEKAITYYQIIYNPENYEFVSISRGMCMNKPDSKICMLSMVHTNSLYRNQKFCQKNINYLIQNVNSIESLDKFALYVEKDNVSAIKCYEKCGFVNISTHKTQYLMELNVQ